MAIYNKKSICNAIKDVELYEKMIERNYLHFAELGDISDKKERTQKLFMRKHRIFCELMPEYHHEVCMLAIKVEDWVESYCKDQYDEIREIVMELHLREIEYDYTAIKNIANTLKEVIQ